MKQPLWTWAALVAASGGNADGTPQASITGFSIDTRSIQTGDVFVALKDARDGHEFVSQAFAAGAVAALVSSAYVRRPVDGALLRVDDTLRGLERIGIAARARLAPEARVIAVTGSAGKTGTKEMLRACLSAKGRTHAPDKSFNNHWGVPLTLARMPADTEYGIFEIGMNHANEIRPLTNMVRPHVAIVTNVLPVHVGNFPDGEAGVAKAKAEIFEGLEAGGTAIILRDGPLGEPLTDGPHFTLLAKQAVAFAPGVRVLTFGRQVNCDIQLTNALIGASAEDDGTPQSVVLPKSSGRREVEYRIGMPGRHLTTNSLAVVATLFALGLEHELSALLAPLANVRPPDGRGARHTLAAPGGTLLLIDESYNANPASMQAALAGLAQTNDADIRRRIAVMGDMLELGDQSADYHRGLLADAARCDLVFACGPNMKLLFETLPPEKRGEWRPISAELISAVTAALRSGDAVMVKGSLGSRMAPIVDAIKKHFSPTPH